MSENDSTTKVAAKSVVATARHELQPASHFGVDLHPDAIALINDSTLLSAAYGGSGK